MKFPHPALSLTAAGFLLTAPGFPTTLTALAVLTARLQAQETLTGALDNPALAWTAGGGLEWKAVAVPDAHAGLSAAELWMPTDPGQPHYGHEFELTESWLETTASGPGIFAVWIRHNNNPYVTLSLTVDGTAAEETQISGWPREEEVFSAWRRFTAFLPPGPRTVRLRHRFEAMGTIPIDNPKVQADDARVLPAIGPDFLNALDLPPGQEGQWFAGGGTEFQVRTGDQTHDGADALVGRSDPASWNDWALSPAWLRREVTGPVTFQWWERRLGFAEGQPDAEWLPQRLFVPPGTRTVTWSGWSLALDEFSETPSPEVSLADALDAGDLVFTPVEGTWKGALTSAAPDGTDAAWSRLSAEGKSALETVIEGPAMLHFETSTPFPAAAGWENAGGALTCSLDGTPLRLLNGSWTGPVPAGRHTVRWSLNSGTPGEKTAGALLDQVNVTPSSALPLGEALNAPGLPWTTGGAKAWTGMTSPGSPDGRDAAVPPVLAYGETAWLETTVTGPGRLTFRWAGVEPPDWWYDYVRGLTLSIDGQPAGRQNGLQPDPSVELGPGPHTLRWTATGLSEFRPLMLDQVVWTPMASVPLLAAVENPALRFFVPDPNRVSVETAQSQEGGGCLRIGAAPTGLPTAGAPALTAVADRAGYLSFYYRLSPAATISTPDGNQAGPLWRHSVVFLEPGARTLTWSVAGLPTEGDPAPHALLDHLVFEPVPEISLAQALSRPGDWRTSPEAPWTGLAQKGAWGGRGTPDSPSWLELDVTGPAVLSFGWSGFGLSLVIDGQEPRPLTDLINGRSPHYWLPAGPHTLRWQSVSENAGLSGVYTGAVRGELTMTVSGPDLLIRVPRPEGMPDSLISLQSNSWGLDTHWPYDWTEIESSTPEALTLRLPRPESGRRFYRAAFGPR